MSKYVRTLADEENHLPQDSSVDTADAKELSKVSKIRQYLWTDVDPKQSSIPLAAYCFMTGFV